MSFDLHALGNKLVQILNVEDHPGWAMEIGYDLHHIRLTRKCVHKDYGLSLHYDVYDDRIRIGGGWVKDEKWRQYPTNADDRTVPITVSGKKSAGQIAADIQRRLIIPYNKSFNKGLVEINSKREYEEKQGNLLGRFKTLFADNNTKGGYYTPDSDRLNNCGPHSGENIGYVMDFSVNASEDEVSFDLRSIPADIAEEMLKVWVSHVKKSQQ